MFAGRDTWETSPRIQTQQENTDVAVVVHSPLNVEARKQRLPAQWFDLGGFSPQNVVAMASQVSLLLVFISLPGHIGGKSLPAAAVAIASGFHSVM